MSRKTVSAVIGSLLVAGFALGAVQGCGSSSSSSDPTALCERSCVKIQMCLADASASSAMAGCTTSCTSNTGGQNSTKCTNSSQIETAYSNCLKISDCTQFEACVLGIPACAGGTGGSSGTGGTTATGGTSGAGTGGTTGTGGTSGAAGGSGTAANCAMCDKAQTCCVAAESFGIPASECTFSTASCNAANATDQTAMSSECQQILTLGTTYNISACK